MYKCILLFVNYFNNNWKKMSLVMKTWILAINLCGKKNSSKKKYGIYAPKSGLSCVLVLELSCWEYSLPIRFVTVLCSYKIYLYYWSHFFFQCQFIILMNRDISAAQPATRNIKEKMGSINIVDMIAKIWNNSNAKYVQEVSLEEIR